MELRHITVSDLKGEQRDLAETVGLETYLKLVRIFGGCNLYIYKADTILRIARDAEIRRRYNGRNLHELVAAFGMSERAVRKILSGRAYPARRVKQRRRAASSS